MKDFILLLRAGVNSSIAAVEIQKHRTSESQKSVFDVDFEMVEELAVKQNVLPLVYDGYKLYYEKYGLEAPVEIKLGWYGAAQQAEKHYNEHLKAIRTMTDYLAENGFRTMVLKGYSLSLCYPKPSHRPCGDIDIYCFGDYKKVDELVSSNALCKVDGSHHHHTVFHWNGIKVENHYDFVNQYSHLTNRRLEPILKKLASDGWDEYDGITLPSPDLSALFVLVHTSSHFAAQSVTLRHLVDWYLLKKHYEGKIDWNFIKKTCTDLGYIDFFDIWEELSAFVFGEDSDFAEENLSKNARKVLDEILNPKFDTTVPTNPIAKEWFLLRRWFASRWKMKLVYTKESLTAGLFAKLYSHWIKPEKLIG